MLTISALYIGLGALVLFGLSFKVSLVRLEHKISLGDGDVPELRRAIRAHGNCAETLPLMLLVVVATELSGAPAWVVHAFGATAIVGRALHASGLLGEDGRSIGRMVGSLATYVVLVLGGLGLIGHALI